MKHLLSNLIFILFIKTGLSNVLELNDKFLDVYKKDHTRSWIIKFCKFVIFRFCKIDLLINFDVCLFLDAPWCGHCRAMGKIIFLLIIENCDFNYD